MLGLKVVDKTEAIGSGPRSRPPPGLSVKIREVEVRVGSHMKYLGLTLDSRWTFGEHSARLGPRLRGEVASLARLLPNIGGPGEGICRLYAAVVSSITLYGAPVWWRDLRANNKSLDVLRSVQRLAALRIVRGYRTIALEAALALAGTPPWELEAEARAEMHEFRARARAERGGRPTPRVAGIARVQARRRVFERWKRSLEDTRRGTRVVEPLRPILQEWAERRQGKLLTFRMVQVLSGHGCFGEYLHRIPKRERTTQCHHCEEVEDTAQHTLEHCPAWADERHVL